MIKERNIAMCIVLSLVTCGIYALYWLVCMANDLNVVADRKNGTSGGMVVVLTIVTCGIYGWFWLYKSGEALDQLRVKNGGISGNQAIIFLLLSIFGLSIVSYALMQSELNHYATPVAQ